MRGIRRLPVRETDPGRRVMQACRRPYPATRNRLVLACLVALASGAGASVHPVEQVREVSARIEALGSVVDDRYARSDLPGLFSADLLAEHFIANARAAARQDSHIAPGVVTLSGALNIVNPFFRPPASDYSVSSSLVYVFDVTANTDYDLQASYGGEWDTEGDDINVGSFQLALTGPIGPLFETQIQTPPLAGGFDPPLHFSQAGMLTPGRYTLTLRAEDRLWTDAPFLGGGGGSDFDLTLRVPEPATLALLLPAGGLLVRRSRC